MSPQSSSSLVPYPNVTSFPSFKLFPFSVPMTSSPPPPPILPSPISPSPISSPSPTAPSPILSSPPVLSPTHSASPPGVSLPSSFPAPPIPPMVTRSQSGIFKPKKPFTLLVKNSSTIEPTSFKEAMQYPEWQTAMSEEYSALVQQGTWSLVPLP